MARTPHDTRSLPATLGVLAAFLIGTATLVACGTEGSPTPGATVSTSDTSGFVIDSPAAGPSMPDGMSMDMTAPMTTTTATTTTTTAAPTTTVAPVHHVTKAPITTKAPVRTKAESSCSGEYYVNSSGNCVHRPEQAATAPKGATAQCKDGTYSFSQHHSGTCSGHHGVLRWL